MKRTSVTIVETLRRRVLVDHPDDWTEDDAYDYVYTEYNERGNIVLTAEDFDNHELYTWRVPEGDDLMEVAPDYVVGADECPITNHASNNETKQEKEMSENSKDESAKADGSKEKLEEVIGKVDRLADDLDRAHIATYRLAEAALALASEGDIAVATLLRQMLDQHLLDIRNAIQELEHIVMDARRPAAEKGGAE